jgi:hypothetical protein
MDPISNVDGLVLLLRQRLAERSRPARTAGERAQAGSEMAQPDAVRALAAVEGVDDKQLRRALIQSLLIDQFGKELINDAKFQQVVSRVVDIIEAEPASSDLLSSATRDLRASAN